MFGCELALQSLAEKLNQHAPITRSIPRRSFAERYSGKYIDRRCNFVVTLRKIKNELCTFIEHANGFVCLTLMPTTTRTARESNPTSLWSLGANRNRGKYVGRWSNDVVTRHNIMNELCTFIEHTNGLVYFTLIPTMTRTARESKPPSLQRLETNQNKMEICRQMI